MLIRDTALPIAGEPIGSVQLAVGEDLGVAVGVSLRQVKQVLVQERPTTEDAKEDDSMGRGVTDDGVERFQ